MNANFNKLEHFISIHPGFDVVALTETCIPPDTSTAPFSLTGFDLLSQSRLGKSGGGVALYVREVYKTKIVLRSNHMFDNAPEYLVVEVRHGTFKILNAVVYRRPKGRYPIELFNSLSDLLPTYTDFIIAGDFNFPMHVSHPDSDYFLNLLPELNIALVPSEPTHHIFQEGLQSHTWSDLFIVPSLNLVRKYSKTDVPFAAGHDLLMLEYDLPALAPKTKVITTRNLTQLDILALCDDLRLNLNQTFPVEPPSHPLHLQYLQHLQFCFRSLALQDLLCRTWRPR